ncbi:MAG: O-methyltransferase [Clostridia bacterium]|nr:O-methyltransferase [Clostridia bacterium]
MNITEKLNILETYAKENKVPIVRPKTAAKLREVVESNKPKNVLEIGTAIGYSAMLMASAMQCDGKITTIEKDEERYNLALENIKDIDYNIDCVLGDAFVILQQFKEEGRKFDFVFLDGPKGFYFRYLNIIEDLLEDGGCIFADNISFFGMVPSGIYPHRHKTIVVSLQNYLKKVSLPPYKTTIEYDIEDGYAITYKEK